MVHTTTNIILAFELYRYQSGMAPGIDHAPACPVPAHRNYSQILQFSEACISQRVGKCRCQCVGEHHGRLTSAALDAVRDIGPLTLGASLFQACFPTPCRAKVSRSCVHKFVYPKSHNSRASVYVTTDLERGVSSPRACRFDDRIGVVKTSHIGRSPIPLAEPDWAECMARFPVLITALETN